MSHQRGATPSPEIIVTVGTDGAVASDGAGGAAAPSQVNAGTNPRWAYSRDRLCAMRSLSARSALKRKWTCPGGSAEPARASRIVAICAWI